MTLGFILTPSLHSLPGLYLSIFKDYVRSIYRTLDRFVFKDSSNIIRLWPWGYCWKASVLPRRRKQIIPGIIPLPCIQTPL